MREIRLSGSEGGVALITPSLPLSNAPRRLKRWRTRAAFGVRGVPALS
jgi:hypothetical protein